MPVSLQALTPKQIELYKKIKKPHWDEAKNEEFHKYLVSIVAQMPQHANVEKIANILNKVSDLDVNHLYICFGNVAMIKNKVKKELLDANKDSVLAMAALGECLETIFEIAPSLIDYESHNTFISFAAWHSNFDYVLNLLERYPHFLNYKLHTARHPACIFARRSPKMFFDLLARYPTILAADDLKHQLQYLRFIIEGKDVKGLFDFLEKYPGILTAVTGFSHESIACQVAQYNPNTLIALLQKYPVLLTYNNVPNRTIADNLFDGKAQDVLFELLIKHPELLTFDPKVGVWGSRQDDSYPRLGLSKPLLLARVASEFEKQLQSSSRDHAVTGLKILVDNKVEAAQMILARHQIVYVSETARLEQEQQRKEEEERERRLKQMELADAEMRKRQTEQSQARVQAATVKSEPSIDQQKLLAEIEQLKETNKNQALALESMSKLNVELYAEIQKLKKRDVAEEVDADADVHQDKRPRKAVLGSSGALSSYQVGKPLLFNNSRTPAEDDPSTASTTMNPVGANVPQ